MSRWWRQCPTHRCSASLVHSLRYHGGGRGYILPTSRTVGWSSIAITAHDLVAHWAEAAPCSRSWTAKPTGRYQS